MNIDFSCRAVLKYSFSAVIVLIMTVFCGIFAVNASAVTTTCTVYEGSNVEAQDYTYYWSQTVESYLTKCSDGRLMRVQNTPNDGIIVEYYDSSYNLKETKKIAAELPIFGAFYETDSNYYLLTGQSNPNESANVECYRLTKYDKNWSRIAAVGLYDCNTYIPFDAGNARITELGKYLIVRTCHEMYQSSDGYHHQANVTIEYDTESMTVTDSYCDVMNVSYGYVSHSFNQFVAVEDNSIVALDHGDAYPRSVALIKYNTDASTGKFVPSYYNSCDYYSMMDIEGDCGVNYTGVKVGGFEISDTSYIAVGAQTDFYDDTDTYNIFVSVLKKGESTPTVTKLTSYTLNKDDYSDMASTPHLVKVGTGKYMLLWSKNNIVYYTYLDGDGKQTDKIYSMAGNLSDCKPIVCGGKLVWYTWDNEFVTFYSINVSAPSSNSRTVIENGHKLVNKGVSNGKATLACSVCSEKKVVNVVTDFATYWQIEPYSYYFLPSPYSYYPIGYTLFYYMSGDVEEGLGSEYVVKSSDPSVVKVEDGYMEMLKTGNVTITVYPKYNPTLKKTYGFKVVNDFDITDLTLGGKASDAIRLNWSQCVNADGYIIEKNDGSGWVSAAKITNNETTTYRVTGLSANTDYQLRMRAYKTDGSTTAYSAYSSTISARTTLSTVNGLALSARTSDTLSLKWTKNTVADGYILEKYDGSKWVRVAKITNNATTTYKVTGLAAGTAYKFRMRTYKTEGSSTVYSAYTSTLAGRTNPSAVTGLSLGGRAADALRLSWTKNTSADGYIIEQYKGGKWVRIAKLTNNSTTTYRITGLAGGTAYKFRVKAYKMSGKTALYSSYTSTLAARTNPSKLSGVKIGGKTSTALRLNWTKNTSADGYIIEIYKGGKWVRAAKITNNTKTTYRISGLAKNTTYKLRIRAYKMSGKTALYSGYMNISGKTTA